MSTSGMAAVLEKLDGFCVPGCASLMARDGSALPLILRADFSFDVSCKSTCGTEPLLLWLLRLPKLNLDFLREEGGELAMGRRWRVGRKRCGINDEVGTKRSAELQSSDEVVMVQ